MGASESTDRDQTFEDVVAAIADWEGPEVGNADATRQLQAHLETSLNQPDQSVWDRDIVERGQGSVAADLLVNGEVGLRLVDSTQSTSVSDLRVALALLADRYNYLIVCWLDADRASSDYRRSVERASSATRLGVERLQFVTGSRCAEGAVSPGGTDAPLRAVIAATLLASAIAGLVGFVLGQTSGLGQFFLLGVAALFAAALLVAVSLS
jgi:hypothetical protein